MSKVLLVCTMAVVGVMIVVLMDRYRLERLRHEFEELRRGSGITYVRRRQL